MKSDPEKSPLGVDDVQAEQANIIDNISATRDVNISYSGSSTPKIPPKRPPRNLPERYERFVGRTQELDALHEMLQREGKAGITPKTAVHGYGGIGKTALAIEYAWNHLNDYPGGLFWISADVDSPLPELVQLAGPMGLAEEDTPEETAERVKATLESDTPTLLILDNLHDATQWNSPEWKKWIPSENCHILITSRDDQLPVERYRLDRLTREDGIALLCEYRADAKADPNAEMLVDWFDGLAIGLTVVGIYMKEYPSISWEAYVESLEKRELGAVRATEDETGSPPDYQPRVDSVFDDLLLEVLSDVERRTLQYAALLPEDYVMGHWLVLLLMDDPDAVPPDLPGHEESPYLPIPGQLIQRGLLRPMEVEQARLSLHRVLRHRLRERLDPPTRDPLLDRIGRLAELRGNVSHGAITDPTLRNELTPLARLSDTLHASTRTEQAALLANWINTPLHNLARFDEIRPRLERFSQCEISEQELVATCSNLAAILKNQGDLPEARRRVEQAIEIQEKHFEPDDPTLATCYSNLAVILWDLGEREELPEARRLMERAIEIQEKHFKPDDPTLATSYSNLAMILKDQGKPREARRRMEQAIEIQEKHFEPDHPTLGVRYTNLAVITFEEGDRKEARRLLHQAESIFERHFPPEHPHVRLVKRSLEQLRST